MVDLPIGKSGLPYASDAGISRDVPQGCRDQTLSPAADLEAKKARHIST